MKNTSARWKVNPIVKYGPSLKLAIPSEIAEILGFAKGQTVLMFTWGSKLIVERIENPESAAGAAKIHEILRLMPQCSTGRKARAASRDLHSGELPLSAA